MTRRTVTTSVVPPVGTCCDWPTFGWPACVVTPPPLEDDEEPLPQAASTNPIARTNAEAPKNLRPVTRGRYRRAQRAAEPQPHGQENGHAILWSGLTTESGPSDDLPPDPH